MSADLPVPGPSTDLDEVDWLYENYDADRAWHEWNHALDWAQRGDFEPLAECLRRDDLPMNNQDVRNWLATGLIDGFTKPRKVTKRPKHVLFKMAGRHFHIDERHLKQFEAMRRVREIQATGASMREAIDQAAKEHNIDDPNKLAGWIKLPRKHWGLQPARHDNMFAAALATLVVKE